MLPRKNRVQKDFFKKLPYPAKTLSGSFATMRAYFNSTDPQAEPKCAFVVSKKVAKTAVQRNLLRRRGYSAVRSALKSVPCGTTFVFYFKKEASKATFKEIEQDLVSLIHQTTSRR